MKKCVILLMCNRFFLIILHILNICIIFIIHNFKLNGGINTSILLLKILIRLYTQNKEKSLY